MSDGSYDANYFHEYASRRKDGHCKVPIGGRTRGYQNCGAGEDAPPHLRFIQQEARFRMEHEARIDDQETGEDE